MSDPNPAYEPSPERLRRARIARRKGRPFGWLREDSFESRIKTDRNLQFYHEVLGLEYLHYGLWQDDPPNIDGLRVAQQRYTERIRDWIPSGVRSILDVGCGTGGNALTLSRAGFDVEGLTPDLYQQRIFTERTSLPFHLSRFELFEPQRTYDLVLMSESCQYVWLDQLFRRTVRLAPGGYLLVADYFRLSEDAAERSGHLWDDFQREARLWGFVAERYEDVTQQVLPTLDLAAQWHQRYILPTARILGQSAQSHYPRLSRLGARLLRKPIGKLMQPRVLDRDSFARNKRYAFVLLRVPDEHPRGPVPDPGPIDPGDDSGDGTGR